MRRACPGVSSAYIQLPRHAGEGTKLEPEPSGFCRLSLLSVTPHPCGATTAGLSAKKLSHSVRTRAIGGDPSRGSRPISRLRTEIRELTHGRDVVTGVTVTVWAASCRPPVDPRTSPLHPTPRATSPPPPPREQLLASSGLSWTHRRRKGLYNCYMSLSKLKAPFHSSEFTPFVLIIRTRYPPRISIMVITNVYIIM